MQPRGEILMPLALIGGILIVYFTSVIISIAVTIGFISLFGIVTHNGILLVSRYEGLRKNGRNARISIDLFTGEK